MRRFDPLRNEGDAFRSVVAVASAGLIIGIGWGLTPYLGAVLAVASVALGAAFLVRARRVPRRPGPPPVIVADRALTGPLPAALVGASEARLIVWDGAPGARAVLEESRAHLAGASVRATGVTVAPAPSFDELAGTVAAEVAATDVETGVLLVASAGAGELVNELRRRYACAVTPWELS